MFERLMTLTLALIVLAALAITTTNMVVSGKLAAKGLAQQLNKTHVIYRSIK